MGSNRTILVLASLAVMLLQACYASSELDETQDSGTDRTESDAAADPEWTDHGSFRNSGEKHVPTDTISAAYPSIAYNE